MSELLEDKYWKAMDELDKKNLEKAFVMFQELSEEDFPNAQIRLAYMFYFGDGTKRDIEKALYWFKKNMDNNTEALRMVGWCYLGLNQQQKAIKCFKESCRRKNMYACNNLGCLYDTGEFNIKVNKNRALVLYTKACKKGNMDGCHNLALLLEKLDCDRVDYIGKHIGILKFIGTMIKRIIINFYIRFYMN